MASSKDKEFEELKADRRKRDRRSDKDRRKKTDYFYKANPVHEERKGKRRTKKDRRDWKNPKSRPFIKEIVTDDKQES